MPRSTTRQNDQPTGEPERPDANGHRKPARKTAGAAGPAASEQAPSSVSSAPSRAKKKAGSVANLPPFLIVEEDTYLETAADPSLADASDYGNSTFDDLDVSERFDLGKTLNRPAGPRGGGIVDLLDETYDNLSLAEIDIPTEIDAPPARRGRTSKRNGVSQPKVEEVLEIVEIEVEALAVEAMADEPALDENEPDAAEIARVAGEVAEADKQEELEKFIDRTLSMEGASVDDSVRIYLREIGRTSLLKSPDESALAEKMAEGRKAAQILDEFRNKQAELEAMINEGLKLQQADSLLPDDAQKLAVFHTSLQKMSEEIANHQLNVDESYRRELEIIQREGAEAKGMLVQANLRLVVSIARRYIGRGLSLLDLVQEGNIGLMKAADKFDHRKGFKFSTYATWWIRQAITRAISDQSRTIRLPVHVTEMVTKLRRAAHELQQKLLREPTEEELGNELGMPAERVRRILDMARHPASLDAPMEEGEDSFLGDFIEDETTGAPEEEASRQMLKEQVEDILSKLTERERKILEMRYGLADDRPRTLEEVAREFNITRERIRQIETRILRKLRYARYGASKLKGYLD